MSGRFFLQHAGTEPPEDMDVQKLVQELLDIRDHFKSLKGLRDEEDAPFLERDAALRADVIRRCYEEGRNNQRTNAGTAYLEDDVSVTMAEPDEFRDWVKRTGNWTCAEIRASKLGVEDWVSQFSALPPGLNREVKIKVKVRRM